MAKVINQYTKGDSLDNLFDKGTTIGECEKCGAEVSKSRCGCDEICHKCGAWLDWEVEEDIDDEFEDFFMDEWDD